MTSPLLVDTPHAPGPMPDEGATMLAALTVQLSLLVKQITADRNEQRARRKAAIQPVPRVESGFPVGGGQSVVPTSGPLVLDLGGPEQGRRWEVRGIAVSDSGNVTTAVAGVANWYVGKATPITAPAANWVPLAPTGWRWTFPNLPNLTTFSSDSRSIISPDRLYCVITSGTPTQGILATAEIKDFDPVDQIVAEVI